MIENDQIAEYRVLASNILEIYKQKGEFAAFELMFNLLGYQIEITQFYFDRRKYFASDEQNIETNESNKEDYKYYLTKTDPTLNKVENFEFNEIVTNKDLTERYELEEFNELVSKYGLECVLGFNDYYYPIKSVNSKGEKTYNKEKEYRYDNKVYRAGRLIENTNGYVACVDENKKVRRFHIDNHVEKVGEIDEEIKS